MRGLGFLLALLCLLFSNTSSKLCLNNKSQRYNLYVEEDYQPLERIAMPVDPNLPALDKMKQVSKLTIQNIPIIESVIDQIQRELGLSAADCKYSVKLADRVLTKAQRPSILLEKPWHGVEHVRDTLRFKARLRKFSDVPTLLRIVLAHNLNIVKIDVRKLFQPKVWGWRFVGFDFYMPNGQIVEFYMPPFELDMAEVKHINHIIFEKWRNQPIEDIDENWLYYELDVFESKNRYDKAWQKFLARNGYASEREAELQWNKLITEHDLIDLSQCPWTANPSHLDVCRRPFQHNLLFPHLRCPHQFKSQNVLDLEAQLREQMDVNTISIDENTSVKVLVDMLENELLDLEKGIRQNEADVTLRLKNAMRYLEHLKNNEIIDTKV